MVALLTLVLTTPPSPIEVAAVVVSHQVTTSFFNESVSISSSKVGVIAVSVHDCGCSSVPVTLDPLRAFASLPFETTYIAEFSFAKTGFDSSVRTQKGMSTQSMRLTHVVAASVQLNHPMTRKASLPSLLLSQADHVLYSSILRTIASMLLAFTRSTGFLATLFTSDNFLS